MYKLKFEDSCTRAFFLLLLKLKASKFKPEKRDIFKVWQKQRLWQKKKAHFTDNPWEIHIHTSVSDSSCNERELMLLR